MNTINEYLIEQISNQFNIEKLTVRKKLLRQKKSNFGDFSLMCFELIEESEYTPNELATYIAQNIVLPKMFHKVENSDGYVNFYLEKKIFIDTVINEILSKKKKFGSTSQGMGKKSLIEHTSLTPCANPHIGRVRMLLVGEFVVRILKFEGYEVETHFWVSDMSKQIAMLSVADLELNKVSFADVINKYREIKKKVKNDIELKNKIDYELVRKAKDNQDAGTKLVEYCMKEQCKIFEQFEVSFDKFDYESEFATYKNVKKIMNIFNKKGILLLDEHNRFYVKGKREQKILLSRSNDTPLYIVRELLYTAWKSEIRADRNIVVLSDEQKDYYDEVKELSNILELQVPEEIYYSKVKLTEDYHKETCSLYLVIERIVYELKKMDEFRCYEDQKIFGIANCIVKFSIGCVINSKVVKFNLKELLKFTDYSGINIIITYINFCTSLSKVKYEECGDKYICEWKRKEEVYELIKILYGFYDCIDYSLKCFSPHRLIKYMIILSKEISKYFGKTVNTDSISKLQKGEIDILFCYKQIMENSFYLLGMEKTIEKITKTI